MLFHNLITDRFFWNGKQIAIRLSTLCFLSPYVVILSPMIFFLNAINFLTVVVGFIVQVLIVRFFGASDATDIYYLILAITTFITGLSTGFLTDLFIPIYHDAKNRGREYATKLTGGVMTLALLSGIVLTMVVYQFAPLIISIFASGFHTGKFDESVRMLHIVSFSIIFTSMTMILNATLNANSFLLVTYLTNMILPVSNLVALFAAGQRYGVAALMYSILFASIASFLIIFVYCKLKVGARFANPLGQKDLKYLLIKNVPVRAANMIHMLRGPVTTTVLSYFPAGFLTLYSYADKIVSTLLGTTNSPIAQFYYIKSSEFSSKKNYKDIKSLLIETVRSSVVLFAGMYFLTVLVFQKIFGILFAGKVPEGGVETMFLLFLSLFPFYYISLLGTELGSTAMAMKKGRYIFYASGTFIVILGASLFLLGKLLSYYALPVALAVGQVFAIVVYIILINNLSRMVERNFFRVQMNTIGVGALMLAANFILANHFAFQIGVSLVLLVIWILANGRSAITAMKFITAKGEIR